MKLPTLDRMFPTGVPAGEAGDKARRLVHDVEQALEDSALTGPEAVDTMLMRLSKADQFELPDANGRPVTEQALLREILADVVSTAKNTKVDPGGWEALAQASARRWSSKALNRTEPKEQIDWLANLAGRGAEVASLQTVLETAKMGGTLTLEHVGALKRLSRNSYGEADETVRDNLASMLSAPSAQRGFAIEGEPLAQLQEVARSVLLDETGKTIGAATYPGALAASRGELVRTATLDLKSEEWGDRKVEVDVVMGDAGRSSGFGGPDDPIEWTMWAFAKGDSDGYTLTAHSDSRGMSFSLVKRELENELSWVVPKDQAAAMLSSVGDAELRAMKSESQEAIKDMQVALQFARG